MDVSTLTKNELASFWPSVDWNMYEEPSPFSFHEAQPTLISFYAVLWVIGAVGNVWVAFVVGYLLVLRNSRRSADAPITVQIYIFSLCLCDLVVLLFLPLLLLDLVYGSWKIPSGCLCKLYLLSEGFNKFGAPWLLTALSGFCHSNIQRMAQFESKNVGDYSETDLEQRKISSCSTASGYYRARKVSETSKRQSTETIASSTGLIRRDSGRKSLVTVLTCCVCVVLAMSPVFFYADIHYVVVHNESEVHILALKCAFQPPEHILTTFTVYSFLAGYLFPACLFTYYYSAILFYVRRHRASLLHTSANSRSQQRYCRVAKTAIGLVGWTLAGWTPYWVIFLYFYFHPQSDSESVNASTTIVLSYFVHMLPYINCTGYPILYTLLNKNIRSAYTRAKMASANRKRRRRLASVAMPDAGTTTPSSRGSGGRMGLGHSHDCSSTCGVLTPMTISLQCDDGSLSLAPSDDTGHVNRIYTHMGIIDQNHLQV